MVIPARVPVPQDADRPPVPPEIVARIRELERRIEDLSAHRPHRFPLDLLYLTVYFAAVALLVRLATEAPHFVTIGFAGALLGLVAYRPQVTVTFLRNVTDRGQATWRQVVTRPALSLSIWQGAIVGVAVLSILGGAWIRSTRLADFPPGIENDEAIEGIMAKDVVQGQSFRLFSDWGYRWETLNAYIAAPILQQTGPEIVPLRIYSTILSLVSLALVFLLGRSLFRSMAGLYAASFLSLSFWHIVYSRTLYRVTLLVPLSLLAAFFLWKALSATSEKRNWLPFAAFSLLSLAAYTTYRAVFIAFFFVLLFSSLRLKEKMTGAVLGFLVPGLVYLGMVYWTEGGLEVVWTRGSYNILGLQDFSLRANLRHSLLFFVEGVPAYYNEGGRMWADLVHDTVSKLGSRPVPLVFSVLGVVGLLVSVMRGFVRGSEAWKFLTILTLVSLAIVGIAGPSFSRLLIVLPFAALLAAAGLDSLVEWTRARSPRWQKIAAAATLAIYLVLAQHLHADIRAIAKADLGYVYCTDLMRMLEEINQDPFPADQERLILMRWGVDVARYRIRLEKKVRIEADDFRGAFSSSLETNPTTVVYVFHGAEKSAEFLQYVSENFPAAERRDWHEGTPAAFTRLVVVRP
jgi:hypothetical protein